jgi:histidinol-phosphate/aromatic aminotransferase/cobyric acid decarboxylase-like protein
MPGGAGAATRPVLAAGPHGGDGPAVARQLGLDPSELLDLSASLNPLAPDAHAVVRALEDGCIRNYPDPELATGEVAAAIGVPAERLLLTNGGAQAIALVAAEHPVGVVPEPAFSLYRRHLARVEATAAALVWRANPSSPLGELAPADARAGVWDEAFWPLATGTWTRGDEGSYRLGSLTKLWSCPGLRLGYVIAPDAQARAALARRQPRWSVNGLALAAIPHLLSLTDLAGWQAGIAALRSELATVWRVAGFTVRESAANWILVEGAAPWRTDLARLGVLVRDCASFGLPGTIRVAVPDDRGLETMARAVRALGG